MSSDPHEIVCMSAMQTSATLTCPRVADKRPAMDRAALIHAAVGQAVRKAREARGLTQEGLAKLVGRSRTSITNIEAGRQRFSVDFLYTIADALEVGPAALLPPFDAVVENGIEEIVTALSPDKQEWFRRVLATGGISKKRSSE